MDRYRDAKIHHTGAPDALFNHATLELGTNPLPGARPRQVNGTKLPHVSPNKPLSLSDWTSTSVQPDKSADKMQPCKIKYSCIN